MEDEATKEDEQPSTSKNDSQRTNSRKDLYINDRDNDEGASHSETSASASYSARSRVEMADARPEPPKPSTLGKKETKAPEKKKRSKRSGRVDKRRRSYRRQVKRAPMRRRHERRQEEEGRHARTEERRHSVSTIFSGRSYRSGSRTSGCVHCGHRCCRRRYENELIKWTCRGCRNQRKRKKKMAVTKKLKKKPESKLITPSFTVLSKQIQTGSRSHVLSPLFINTNSTPEAEVALPEETYNEVTPEMIFDSLRVLTLWREEVETAVILKYIMMKYPVNRDENELLAELTEKLGVAAIVGIVRQTSEDCWSVAGELEERRLTANHVTLFWRAYADTLRPIFAKKTNLQIDSFVLPSKTTRGSDTPDNFI